MSGQLYLLEGGPQDGKVVFALPEKPLIFIGEPRWPKLFDQLIQARWVPERKWYEEDASEE